MSLMRSAMTVGGMTLVSRVLGFVRDVLLAAMLGASWVAEAFVVAFRLPNLFRRFFGEGAFNSAFVPLFAGRLEKEGTKSARQFAEEAFAGLLFVLLVLTVVAELFMPAFVYALAPGFAAEPEKFELAVLLTRITFPYLLCMSLLALLSGVLNSLHRFALAAFAPVLLNVVFIVVLVYGWIVGLHGSPKLGVLLAAGVTLGGVVQVALLWVAARRAGFAIRLRRPRYTPAMKRLVQLGVPGLIAGGITQLNLVISTIIASWQKGAPAWLYYADRVYQLPLGLVGVAIGVVLLPDISRKLRGGDGAGVQDSQNRALEFALFLTLPAALALMAMPVAVVQVLFERGAFTHADTIATAQALAAFAAGLPAFVLIKVFSPAFFAREDTKTPMIFAAISVGINIVLAIALFPWFQHVGIALATTVASWVNTVLLGRALHARGYWRTDAQVRRNVPLMMLSAFVMGIALLAAMHALANWFTPETSFLARLFWLLVLITGGAALYLGLSWKLRVLTKEMLRQALKRTPKEPANTPVK